MFSSIRIKLTLWYTFAITIVIVVFSFLVYATFVGVLRSETDAGLTEMANNFVIAVNAEQNDEDKKPQGTENIAEALDAFRFRDYQFAVVSINGETVGKTTKFDLPPDLTIGGENSFTDIPIQGELFRRFQNPLQIGDEKFNLFVFRSLDNRIGLEDRLRYSLFIVVPFAIFLAGIGGYFVARRSFQPIKQMSDRAGLITSQNLHERLPVANQNDELGNLANAFNDLLDRLDKSFEQQRRFMTDASHELRTPLAIVRGESEVALSKDDRTAADYQESLSIVHDESKRLTQIVEDLFMLSRADSGKFNTSFSDVYLDELTGECVHSIRTLAAKRSISINFEAEEMHIQGDESLLRRLILNLLDNALKYNYENGRIAVSIKNAQISITNTGPEILAGEQDEIFERFYRADKGRSRSQGSSTSGAGLGLSISKWIAELHGAELQLAKSTDGENTFTLTFTC